VSHIHVRQQCCVPDSKRHRYAWYQKLKSSEQTNMKHQRNNQGLRILLFLTPPVLTPLFNWDLENVSVDWGFPRTLCRLWGFFFDAEEAVLVADAPSMSISINQALAMTSTIKS